MGHAVQVRGVRLEPALINGSGVIDVVSVREEWNLPTRVVSKLGAFVTKTVTRAPRAGNAQPWAEVCGPGSLVNAAGLPNPGIDAAVRQWQHLPDLLGIPVIMSLGGDPADLAALAAQVEAAGWLSGIELNLSCPNVHGGLLASDPSLAAAAVASVRSHTALPIFAKLTPACGDVAAVARAVVDSGADALTCGNTMPVRVPGVLGAGDDGGLSGAALHAINLRLVAEARAAVEAPIVGLGGVDGVEAAVRMRDAGATVIGVGTGAVLDPELIPQLAELAVSGSR